jgi:catechol 2,3-dioxygenase-like lactoylglutathione lyase family enzyme
MIDHLGCGVSDMDRAVKWYEQALAPLGYKLMMRFPTAAGFGADGKPDFWIAPSGGSKPSPIHVAFVAKTRSVVDAFYAAAIAAGGTDNGKPGTRPLYHEHYYGAYVHDPDGHNVEAVCHDAYLG